MFTALAIGGSALVGAGASIYAANKQSNAAGQSGQMTMDQYNQNRASLAPWVGTGEAANDTLAKYLGTSGPPGLKRPTRQDAEQQVLAEHLAKYGVGYGKYSDMSQVQASTDSIYNRMMSDYNTQLANAPQSTDSTYGSLLKPYTGDSLTSDPGYQFGLSEGEKGIDRMAQARGTFNSGATMKALLKYNEDYAGTKFNEGFSRDASQKNQTYNFLSGQSNSGVNAAGQTAGLGANATMNAGNSLMQGADANAAGLVGGANAVNSGVGNYLSYNNNQSMMDYLKQLRGSTFGGSTPAAQRM